MGKQSTRENKTIYQLCREAAGRTRAEASDKMKAVSESKIEKIEYETQEKRMEMKCMRSFRKFMMRVLAEILIRKKWKIGRKTGAEKRKWLGFK